MKQNQIKFALFALVGGLFFAAFFSYLNPVGLAQRAAVDNIGVAPTLGSYPATVVREGGNGVVTPSAAPMNTVRVTARTSANFKGVLSVNPTTGVVRVTGATAAGVYTVTVTAFDASTGTATTTFTLRVLQTSGCSPFSTANFTQATGSPFAVQTTPFFTEVVDFNNDGIADVVVANFGSNSVSLLTGTGTGGFNAAVNIPTGGNSPQFIAVSDYNGDGNQDFAVGNSASNRIAVLLGNGAGGFAQAAGSPFASGGSNPRGIVAADFNGDGRVDLAVANNSSSNVAVFTGNGTGGFTPAAGSPITVGTSPFGIVKGFFNADGAVDLAVANINSNNLSILLGSGAGGFTVSTTPTVNTSPRIAAVADFNNDGFQDLAVDSIGTNNLSILLGTGAGVFTSGTSINVGFVTLGITAADFNGDGNQDILASQNANPGAVTLQLGTGGGTFTSGGTFTNLATPRGYAVADYNGDARLDFAVLEGSGNGIRSYLGGCTVNITNNAPSLPNASQNAPYSTTISATGGTMPYTFSATGLPAGLTINATTGEISGMTNAFGTFTPRISITDSTPLIPTVAQTTAKSFQLIANAPTAANVSVSGRVSTANGNGLRNAIVTLTDAAGNTRTARTGSFGYYQFEEVEAGQTYVVAVQSKRFVFNSQVVQVVDNIADLDFTAQ